MVFHTFFRPRQNFEVSLYESWIDGQSDELITTIGGHYDHTEKNSK